MEPKFQEEQAELHGPEHLQEDKQEHLVKVVMEDFGQQHLVVVVEVEIPLTGPFDVAGAGGGAGGFRTGTGFSVSAGTTYTVTVGGGGAAGVS